MTPTDEFLDAPPRITHRDRLSDEERMRRRQSGGQDRYRRFLSDGSENPRYSGRSGNQSKFERGEFVAADGEGRNDPDRYQNVVRKIPMMVRGRQQLVERRHRVRVNDHRFVLFSTSSGNAIRNPDGLTTEECLAYLIREVQQRPRAIFVAYAAQYDFECILRDLPRALLQQLWKGETVFWRGYGLKYLPRHYLWVQDNDARRTHSYEPVSITIWDTVGFFQQSFLKTLRQWYPDCPDLDLIAAGKELRNSFGKLEAGEYRKRIAKALRIVHKGITEAELGERVEALLDRYPDPTGDEFEDAYNMAENRSLVVIMERFRQALIDAGIPPLKNWDGAGAIAMAILQHEGVSQHTTRVTVEKGVDDFGKPVKVDRDQILPGVRKAALHGYFGANIQLVKAGNRQAPCWGHDVGSAYPWALPDLPSLRDGRWTPRQGEPKKLKPYALYRVRWWFEPGAPFYPLPYRTAVETILFPQQGEGWYWGVELIAARKWNPRGIKVLEWWDFQPATDVRPFDFVRRLAAYRLALKAAGNPAHIPLKLGLNAIPGKLSQQRGIRFENPDAPPAERVPTRIPRYFQPEWSGYVLAKTRAAVYDAAMQNPGAIVSFNTDAVYATDELTVDQGKGLGQWEVQRLDWIATVQSGVFYYATSEEPDEVVQHFRGFDRDSISLERVLAAWADGERILTCQLTRLVTLGQALKHKGDEADFKHYWLTWRQAPRDLRLDLLTGKRTFLRDEDLQRAARELVDTQPVPNPTPTVISAKTRLLWAYEAGLLDQPDEEYDGTMLSAVLADWAP